MTKFSLYWIAEDGQSSLKMGAFETRAEAEAAIPGAKAELVAQGGTGDGEWEIEPAREPHVVPRQSN